MNAGPQRSHRDAIRLIQRPLQFFCRAFWIYFHPVAKSIQISAEGALTHLLTTEGIPRALLLQILDRAKTFLNPDDPKEVVNAPLLAGKSVFNLFLRIRPGRGRRLKSLQNGSQQMWST